MTETTIIIISLLTHDPNLHRFLSEPVISCVENGMATRLSIQEARKLKVAPSEAWLEEYHHWNDFDRNPNGFCGLPIFADVNDLHRFNDQGQELETKLKFEMIEQPRVHVQPFLPLFSNMELGASFASWWHVRDKSYGNIVPIQHLPVSDNLKSRLQAWRMRCSSDWTIPGCREDFVREGRDIEEHLIWELNVLMSDEGFVESIGYDNHQRHAHGVQTGNGEVSVH